MGVLSLLLPVVLATYFLYQSGRRPIFLLGIPFLQVMRESIFFGTLRPFWIPGRLGPNGAILIWMTLAWAWCVVRTRAENRSSRFPGNRRPPRLLAAEYPLVALGVLVLVKLFWGGVASADTPTLLSQFAPWGLLITGYVLVRGVVRRSSSQDVAAFLLAVAVATAAGSVLFILHQGLRVPIYHVKEYLVFFYGGQRLSRTYLFMSPFLLVALAVGVALVTGRARPSGRAAAIALVAVSLVAVVVSYTRNYVLSAAAVIAVILALRSLKERRLDLLVRRSFPVAAVLAIAAVVLMSALPAPTDYFLNRMASLTRASTVLHDPNLMSRQSNLSVVGATVFDRQWLTGAPYGVADDMARKVAIWIPDSTWVGVVFWTGFVGVALVVGTFILFGLRAFRLFLSSGESTEFLGAVCFAGLVAMFINSLSGWSFLDSSAYAMGFWLFAFVAGEAAKGTDLGPMSPESADSDLEEAGVLPHDLQRGSS